MYPRQPRKDPAPPALAVAYKEPDHPTYSVVPGIAQEPPPPAEPLFWHDLMKPAAPAAPAYPWWQAAWDRFTWFVLWYFGGKHRRCLLHIAQLEQEMGLGEAA